MSTMMSYETLPCCVCKLTSMVDVDSAKLARWRAGEHVQDVWPEMSADDRELLITGIHPNCWDWIFAEDEEES